jgi:hypothetical protein
MNVAALANPYIWIELYTYSTFLGLINSALERVTNTIIS